VVIKTRCTYNQWKFPGGEIGIKLTGEIEKIQIINWLVEPSKIHEEFFVLANLIDALSRHEVKPYIQLVISYLPYARQDRVCNSGESYARFVFEEMLSSFPVDSFILYDPHSESLFTTDERTLCYHQAHLAKTMIDLDYDLLIAPDKGAEEKTKKLSDLTKIPYLFLDKERADGKVIHKPLPPMMQRYSKALVVDDICDGGATFLSVAEAVRKFNPGHFETIDLWVTHGIFSKGLSELQKHFNKISCYNLMNPDLVDQIDFTISPFAKEKTNES
jgi:ribose-phosphate pyrophosphokinase